jgi:hypothetical protein
VQVSVEVPPAGITMVITLSEQDALPVDFTDRVTVFEKPLRAATVMVEVPPGEPTFVVTLVGLAVRSIPPETAPVTVTDMVAVELVMSLLVPPIP